MDASLRWHDGKGVSAVTIVHGLKFAIGCVFLAVGAIVLIQSRNSRGFGQKRQLGLLLLAAGAVFLALGLGWIGS